MPVAGRSPRSLLVRARNGLRGTRGLVVVAVVCLMLAVPFALLALRDAPGAEGPTASPPSAAPEDTPSAEATTGPATVSTERVVVRRAGLALAVPTDMQVRRRGGSVQLRGTDPELVVDVGRATSPRVTIAHQAVLRSIGRGYAKVRVIGRERGRVHGRRTLTTSGTAVNDAGVPIRFVVVTLAARPQAFTLAAFTARDAPPQQVLPRVNAVVNGFEVLPR
ncbi:MAG TPA: hypothetical protein VFV40_00465 [Nocardioides sp.]|nr:hypothetical protein [Nocardioides sp.]